MAGRPVFHPALGAYFKQLREQRGFKNPASGQSDAARQAERQHLRTITRQIIVRLEAGRTKWPDPDVLRDLAALYRVPYTDIVARVTADAYGPIAGDLPRPTSGTSSGQGDSDHVASGASPHLFPNLDAVAAALRDIQAKTFDIRDALGIVDGPRDRGESRTTKSGEARPRHRHRSAS